MAKSRNNVVTHGLSGLIGDLLVFRQRSGKTIVADRPRLSSKEPTAFMLAVREKFRKAAIYAKAAIMNPIKKAAYQAVAVGDQTAYNIAFADYQKAPVIEPGYDFSNYTGEIGQVLKVEVTDNFLVTMVKFSILDQSGDLIEEGDADQLPDLLGWSYTVTASNASFTGSKIVVKAYDTPGNESVVEQII